MKALDVVKTPKGNVAWVVETNGGGKTVSINFFGGGNPDGEKNAWWESDELVVIDSIPKTLALATAHPFGKGKADVHSLF